MLKIQKQAIKGNSYIRTCLTKFYLKQLLYLKRRRIQKIVSKFNCLMLIDDKNEYLLDELIKITAAVCTRRDIDNVFIKFIIKYYCTRIETISDLIYELKRKEKSLIELYEKALSLVLIESYLIARGYKGNTLTLYPHLGSFSTKLIIEYDGRYRLYDEWLDSYVEPDEWSDYKTLNKMLKKEIKKEIRKQDVKSRKSRRRKNVMPNRM